MVSKSWDQVRCPSACSTQVLGPLSRRTALRRVPRPLAGEDPALRGGKPQSHVCLRPPPRSPQLQVTDETSTPLHHCLGATGPCPLPEVSAGP